MPLLENHPFQLSAPRTAPVGRGALDHELRFLAVDATLAELHGMPAAAQVGQPLAHVMPTLAPMLTPLLRHVLTTGEPILDVDVRGELPDGRPCRWLASYYPVCTRAGAVIAVECAVRALDQRAPFTALATTQTARHQATDQMAFHATILDNLNDAVIAVDLSDHITYWGPGAERLYGFTAAEVRGHPLREVIRYQSRDPAEAQALLNAVRENGVWRGELRHSEPNGAVLTTAVAVSTLTNAQGQRTGFLSVARDITAQKQAEVALRTSEERFRQFAAAVKDIFWISDPAEHRLVYVSPAYEQIMGRSGAALYADFMEWINAIHPDDRERVSHAFFGGVSVGTYEEEFRIIRPDGSVRWLRDRGFPIWDAEGNVVRAAGIAEDITLRKAQERRIEIQARMLDTVGEAVIATDLDGVVRYWNRGAEQLYGWSSAEVQGRNAIELLVGAPDRDEAIATLATLQHGNGMRGEFSVYRRDGTCLDVLVTQAPVYDPPGQLIGFVGVTVDITQRKRAELEQARLLEVTTALAHALTPEQIATVIFANVHKALGAHAGAIVLLAEDGYTLELLGSLTDPPIPEVLQHPMNLDTPVPLVESLRSGQPLWAESAVEIGTRYPHLAESLPEASAYAALPLIIQQRVIGALGMIFTNPRVFAPAERVYLQLVVHQCAHALERAWLYEAERRAHHAAKAAVRMRDDLLALVTHDLRNPLAVILGQTQLLIKQAQRLGETGEALIPKLTMIRTMGSQINDQIGDLLDTGQMNGGKTLTLSREPLDLVALLAEIVRAHQARSAHHQITLVASEATLVCQGDRRRLVRVFDNLLNNALHYSPHGGPITVQVSRATDDAGTWGVVSVQDAGLGIPAADLPHIFEQFYRGANVAGRIRGTGLGLTSAQQIVALHAGRIQVASDEGYGSTFTIHLPWHSAAPDTSPQT